MFYAVAWALFFLLFTFGIIGEKLGGCSFERNRSEQAMRKHIIGRLLYSLVILFLVSILIFTMVRLLPGAPVAAVSPW